MAVILALDTTHEYGSLALARGDELVEEWPLHEPSGFSRALYGHLEALLARHSLSPADIDCWAAASGPGSFTGVRVGLACIKGLAEALGKPAVAVSNLEALARCGTSPLRGVVLDARRDEIYGAVYDASGALVSPEVVARFPSWLATLPSGVGEFICYEYTPPPVPAPVVAAPRAIAGAVAQIAAERLSHGQACDPAALEANYVRRSDAEIFFR
jgi:tRNA threonylcarbamoyladenosine biosynthesis protein TsaB